jgi:hypothetical protein
MPHRSPSSLLRWSPTSRRNLAALFALVVALVAPATAQATTYTGTPDPTGQQVIKVGGSDPSFYPYVHDGYKDYATFKVWLSDPTDNTYYYSGESDCTAGNATPDYTAKIISKATGGVVRTLTWNDSYGSTVWPIAWDTSLTHTFKWDGRKSDGTLVKSGSHYRVEVSATATCMDSNGNSYTIVSGVSPAFTLTPTSGYVTKTKSLSRRGRYASYHSSSGYCLSTPNGYDWSLNCSITSGSAYAAWTFHLPSGATGWAPSAWHWLGTNYGPWQTSVSTSGSSRTVTISVGGYAWSDVERVHVNYYIKVRI